ncbi:MAG: hypothetical protein WC485_09150 [Opitutaceae bacterium]
MKIETRKARRGRLTAAGCAIAALAAACGLWSWVCGLALADSVAPETAALVSLRGESVKPASDVSVYRGASLLLSNCVAYAGTSTNADVQGLSNVTCQVTVGLYSTNAAVYTGTVYNAYSRWKLTFTVPDTDDTYLQLKLIDGEGNSYIYPWKVLKTKESL